MRLCLRKPERLRHPRQFKELYLGGRKISGPHLTIFFKANHLPFCRLGLSVSKRRFKLSVQRHYIQRRLREAFRRNKSQFLPGYDIVIIARGLTRGQSPFSDISRELLVLAQSAELSEKRC